MQRHVYLSHVASRHVKWHSVTCDDASCQQLTFVRRRPGRSVVGGLEYSRRTVRKYNIRLCDN